MKIRNGFVSNSSSSSFMIGIARIVDREKFDLWAEQLGMEESSPYETYKVYKLKDIPSNCYSDYCHITDSGDIIADSFISDVRLKTERIKPEDEILVINIINDEGDSDFTVYDEDGDFSDYDYDIDLSHFDTDQSEFYEGMVEANGLADIQKTYGAGRNG